VAYANKRDGKLMFLLLCVRSYWQIRRCEGDQSGQDCELGLFGTVLGVLWLNGSPNGSFHLPFAPQVLDWFLFFVWPAVLMMNLLRTQLAWRSGIAALVLHCGRSWGGVNRLAAARTDI